MFFHVRCVLYNFRATNYHTAVRVAKTEITMFLQSFVFAHLNEKVKDFTRNKNSLILIN